MRFFEGLTFDGVEDALIELLVKLRLLEYIAVVDARKAK